MRAGLQDQRQISTIVASGAEKILNGRMPQPTPLDMKTSVPFMLKCPWITPSLGNLSVVLNTLNSNLKGSFICPPWKWPESMYCGLAEVLR